MGFRYGKSIKVAKGVRLNVTKTGLGLSVGGKGMRYSVHSSGRRTTTVGLPGTGMSYVSSAGGGRRSATSGSGSRATASSSTTPASPPPGVAETVRRRKPGVLSPKGEKALHKAVSSGVVPAISQVASDFPDYAIPSRVLAGLMLAAQNEAPHAKELLDAVFRSEADPGAHPFMRKYLPAMGFQVGIAPGITVALPLSRDSVGLLLAEVYQAIGDLTSAIDVVEQVDSTTHAAVSLADLYIEAGRYDDVVDLTEGIANEDDSTALLLVFRGIALREKGYNDAAREAFKEALKSKKRDSVIRHRALLERSRSYLSDGKKAQAKKDLERILAEDSTYEGLRAALAELESR